MMIARTLADVRVLIERHLPKAYQETALASSSPRS
jgi:hypothetical protein